MFSNNVKQRTQDKLIDDWAEQISCHNRQAETYKPLSSYPTFATYTCI